MFPSRYRLHLLIGSIFLFVVVSGCGYRLAGTGSSLPPHLKTISIPIFKNTSSEPTIERTLTNSVRRAFLTDGRLKLIKVGKRSDLVLKGTLNFYDIRAVSFSSNDVALEYWVYLGVEVEALDRVKKKVYMKQKFRTRWDYRATSSVVSTEASRQEALKQAYRDVSIRLVSLVIDQF